MRYIVIELEATCWEWGEHPRDDMEIIEVGAVVLATSEEPPESEFASFVPPMVCPVLSNFCKQLTSIRQENVDTADLFPAVLRRLRIWIGSGPFTLRSWGRYDLGQLDRDCQCHRLRLPPTFMRHINLKREFGRMFRVELCGMTRALEIAGLPLEGIHHRGADDARNIAQLAMLVLPRLGVEGANSAFAK